MHRGYYCDGDDDAAVAATGPSRQLFYRDRLPQLPSESREYALRPAGQLNLPAASTDSSESSVDPYPNNEENRDGSALAGTRRPSLPPPQQLHADYREQLYKNQLESGHTGPFVVGGTHGRFRGNGGTLIEVSEEVYAVRKAALTVLDPITYCWLILSSGFSISVLLGALKWTEKLYMLPYWAIFIPAWSAHGGIVIMHILSARALSKFISEANENRQRLDSTDHLDRVEYLPLLQRSLKFGLKTGVLCFIVFIFEILLSIRLSKPSAISLAETYIPFWILTIGFISNGVVCKSQHFLLSLVWIMVFTAMLLSVLMIDYGITAILISHIISTILALLAIISGILIYLVYGHQIGYFKLTDGQLTAGVLYSMSSFLTILLVALMGQVIELPEIIVLDLDLIIVILAPIVVALAGFGAWLVTRDEFDRLLRDGGQSAVIPMRLRLEADGWTSVESRGIVTIPMFGDVRYKPLDHETAERLSIELCGACCSACYPKEEEEDLPHYFHGRNTYQSPTPPTTMAVTARWGGGETIV